MNPTAEFNPVLSEALNRIGKNQFVGLQIFPERSVNYKNGTYPIFPAGQFDNNLSKEKTPGGEYPRKDSQYNQGIYICKKYGLEEPLNDEDANQAESDGILDAKGTIATNLARDIMIGHELRVAAKLQASSVFNETAASAAMSSADTVKPITDIQNAVERLNGNGFYDNLSLIIENSLFNEMINSDNVKAIFNGSGQFVDRGLLLKELGVSKVIICQTRYNAAAKGKAANRTKVWQDNAYYVAQTVGGAFSNGGIGRTLAYQPNGGIFTVESYRSDKREADIQRVKMCTDEVIINGNAGEKITEHNFSHIIHNNRSSSL